MKLYDLNHDVRTELIEFAIDKLNELKGCNIYGCDLHNDIFNTDYYIIGRYESEKWLENVGVFYAIGEIKEYEEFNFGEVITDIGEAERVVNMFVYIVGEIILQESETLQNNWDKHLTDENFDSIIEELKEL